MSECLHGRRFACQWVEAEARRTRLQVGCKLTSGRNLPCSAGLELLLSDCLIYAPAEVKFAFSTDDPSSEGLVLQTVAVPWSRSCARRLDGIVALFAPRSDGALNEPCEDPSPEGDQHTSTAVCITATVPDWHLLWSPRSGVVVALIGHSACQVAYSQSSGCGMNIYRAHPLCLGIRAPSAS